MIIRSGLIRKHDNVDFASFTRHWRENHAPLALRIKGMLGYAQNHISRRLFARETAALHRIDGISQLNFESVEAMKAAIQSEEQAACVVDLKGFLSDVTLLIQERRVVLPQQTGSLGSKKSMFLLGCDPAVAESVARSLLVSLQSENCAAQYRFNPIIERNLIVDHSIPAGDQIVNVVAEFWIHDDRALDLVCSHLMADELEPIAGFEVSEEIFLKE